MNKIHILKWWATDEDRRLKYVSNSCKFLCALFIIIIIIIIMFVYSTFLQQKLNYKADH